MGIFIDRLKNKCFNWSQNFKLLPFTASLPNIKFSVSLSLRTFYFNIIFFIRNLLFCIQENILLAVRCTCTANELGIIYSHIFHQDLLFLALIIQDVFSILFWLHSSRISRHWFIADHSFLCNILFRQSISSFQSVMPKSFFYIVA